MNRIALPAEYGLKSPFLFIIACKRSESLLINATLVCMWICPALGYQNAGRVSVRQAKSTNVADSAIPPIGRVDPRATYLSRTSSPELTRTNTPDQREAAESSSRGQ
jgi:hypothetical protein